jgi:hypothetical protein
MLTGDVGKDAALGQNGAPLAKAGVNRGVHRQKVSNSKKYTTKEFYLFHELL